MDKVIDARGLSCPQPVLMILSEIKALQKGEIVIKVDTDTSKENVSRAAESKRWQVKDVQSEGEEYRITITKD